jgi:hypothetical protein
MYYENRPLSLVASAAVKMVSLLHKFSFEYRKNKCDYDRNILMQEDKKKFIMVADKLDYPRSDPKAELELLMKAEVLLKSVCKIAITEDAANQECS